MENVCIKMNVEDIDKLHQKNNFKNKVSDSDIYKIMSENYIRYLMSNQYLKKMILYTLIPFVTGIIAFQYLTSQPFSNKYIELLYVLVLIWIWYNKNTCYVVIKVLMVFYSIFPSYNIFYNLTDGWISYIFVRVFLGLALFILSSQITYQVVIG